MTELAAWEHEARGPGGQWISYEHGRMRTDLLPVEATGLARGALAPRKYGFDDLVESIRKYGVQKPIALRHDSGGLIIANGRHRAEAAREAGVPDVPVIVQHADGVNPRAVPLRLRHPTDWNDWLRHWQQKPVDTIQASNISAQVTELAGWEDAWRHELRDPHGRWTRGGGSSYETPDPDRLVNPRSPYPRPEDHPFFQAHPVSPAHVIAAWDTATPEQREQGMRWYHDAHTVAAGIAKEYLDGDTEKAAGMLAAFSPQTAWPINMFNAAHAAEQHDALSFKGQATGTMKAAAQRALDGQGIDKANPSPKTNSFGHLITEGGDRPSDKIGDVVVDRHALDVATGEALTDRAGELAPIGKERWHEYVADQYRLAAQMLSDREGTTLAPHQVQAVTWLVRQAEAEAADRAAATEGSMDRGALGRMRGRVTRNAWQQWTNYVQQRGDIQLQPGTTFHAEPITAAEARGNSQPVSGEQFQRLAAEGLAELQSLSRGRAPITGLDQNWASIKDRCWPEVQKSWGGATIDAHTGRFIESDADKYALSVKPAGFPKVSVPETAGREEFMAAMNLALDQYRDQLELGQRCLGVFHDDDNHRIDIDPVLVVDTPHEVDTIGAYTHAVGGAYHFRSGDGYWPPHVEAGQEAPWASGRGQASGAALPTISSQVSALSNSRLSSQATNLTTDLAWTDAWKTEKRDSHGRWTRGSKSPGITSQADSSSLPDSSFVRDANTAIIREWRKATIPEVKFHLNRASAYLTDGFLEGDSGRYGDAVAGAAEELRAAAGSVLSGSGIVSKEHVADADRYELMARNLEAGSSEAVALRQTVQDFAAKGAPIVPDLLGGGTEQWNGKVTVFPDEDDPAVAALINWRGRMDVSESVAKHLKTALDLRNEPINDTVPFAVILHELIHGVTGGVSRQQAMENRKKLGISEDVPYRPEPFAANQEAYQDSHVGAIEEGFTELGTIHHAPEFFDKMGIGSRETFILANDQGLIPGLRSTNPVWAKRKQSLLAEIEQIRSEVYKEWKDTQQPHDSGTWQHAVNTLDGAITGLDNYDDPDGVATAVSELTHLGTPANQARAETLSAKLDTLINTSQDRHATLSEYAKRLQDPVRIGSGDAWGHYAWQTAAAQEFVQEVAKAEGHSNLTSGKGLARVRELADEINRQGAAGKVRTMAQQVARAAGVDPKKIIPDDWGSIELNIKNQWFRTDTKTGVNAFRYAKKAVQALTRQDKPLEPPLEPWEKELLDAS